MNDSKKLDARAFGFAGATIAAALTTLCAFALAVAPGATTAVASTLIHLDLSEMSRKLSWGVYINGLIGWTIGAGVVFWAAAAVYNRFTAERSPVESAKPVFAAR
jgi:hypothetical protein